MCPHNRMSGPRSLYSGYAVVDQQLLLNGIAN